MKYTVTVRGTYHFDKTVIVHADTEENAADAAIEKLEEAVEEGEEFHVGEIYAEPYKESEYEIGVRVKRQK